MGLALLFAAALQAAAADPAQQIYEAKFAPLAPSERQYASTGPAGPYLPELAFRARQSGEAVLRCVAGPKGDLQQCVQVSEKPDRWRRWQPTSDGRRSDVRFPSRSQCPLLARSGRWSS